MQIEVKTDSHIDGSTKLTHQVETVVEEALRRFGDRITRVAVHLSDQNSSHKLGGNDKRCVMEARLVRLKPITVSHRGSSLEEALHGAADTLQETLTRTLTRKSSLFKRRARAQAVVTTVDPPLQHDAAVKN